MSEEEHELEFECEHTRLSRLDKEPPRFHNLYVCEQCGSVIEVVIGRVLTTEYLQSLLKLIEGNGTPSPPPVPDDA
jgi:Fe2+ or Zn2+ uptake regulation protein